MHTKLARLPNCKNAKTWCARSRPCRESVIFFKKEKLILIKNTRQFCSLLRPGSKFPALISELSIPELFSFLFDQGREGEAEMGISGLMKLIGDYAPSAMKENDIKSYFGIGDIICDPV